MLETLDPNIIDYIFIHYGKFMTEPESEAYRHWISTEKLSAYGHDINDGSDSRVKVYKARGWLTTDQDALQMLNDGFDSFKKNVASRIYEEHRSDIFLNYCPNCRQLARTPKARQCRQGHTW